MKLSRKSVERLAFSRGRNFTEAILAAGVCDAQTCEVDEETWLGLLEKHPTIKKRPGLGDLVAAVATPIARALHLSCIDPATKQLRPESGCAKRKAALNRLTQ